MRGTDLALIELLLVFGAVMGLAVWQWWGWRKWRRTRERDPERQPPEGDAPDR